MSVSVILVAYHSDQWLPACVESLANASTDRLHLVLVDNAGNTVLDQLDLSAFDLEYMSTPHPMGFADANNYALARAARLRETVLFLNQDTISTEGWIDQCVECFHENPAFGAVSPLITTYDGSDWDPSFLDCVGSAVDLVKRLDRTDEICFQTRYAPAPALLVRTEVLVRTGPFDPIFGSYYEDYDLCRRITEIGYRVGFCTMARLAHFSGSSTDTRQRELARMRQIIRNRLIHKLRESDGRYRVLAHHWLIDTPRRLVRGIMGTSTSQPPAVVLRANIDLLRLGLRLVSSKRDEGRWQKYLDEIGWNEVSRRYLSSADERID